MITPQIIWSSGSNRARQNLISILFVIIVVNFSLGFYGIGLFQTQEMENFSTFLSLSLFSLVITHLPIFFDILRLFQRRPPALFGSYFVSLSLWMWTVGLILVTFFLSIFDVRWLNGAVIISFLAVMSAGVSLLAAYGLPLFFWMQLFFWYFLAPGLVRRALAQDSSHVSTLSDLIHPDLRKSHFYKILFVLLGILYIPIAVICHMYLTVWLIPPNSGFWESWMF